MKLQDWPIQLKPRERAEKQGMHALSDAELMAILLRTGNRKQNVMELAHAVMVQMQGDWSKWRNLDGFFWKKMGLGRVQVLTIQAAMELASRVHRVQTEPVTMDKGMEWVRAQMASETRELFFVLALDARNQLIGLPIKLNQGTRSNVGVEAKEVVSLLSQRDASKAVIMHNHPSQQVDPSAADIMLTKKLWEALQWVEIELVDHVIVSKENCFSFKENGMLE